MVIDVKLRDKNLHLKEKAEKIKVILTDVDGVLTDTGVYYGQEGEAFRRFSIRDGMGVERLRKYVNVETGIVTGEDTEIVRARANKLQMKEIHLGINRKDEVFNEILSRRNLKAGEVAYIGDDSNDVTIMKLAGLTACPKDATMFAKNIADVIVNSKGGNGAFRDFAELIIEAKTKKKVFRKDDDEVKQS